MTPITEAVLATLTETSRQPPAKALAMLLRSTFIAGTGRTFVWGDWSAIEARVLPWLASPVDRPDPDAERLLQVFRDNDADPTRPDIYMITAADIIDADPVELWQQYRDGDKAAEDVRQGRGKVPVLSLGFGGAEGALGAMATNYGVYMDDETKKRTVARWRETNPWAPRFWGKHNRHESDGLWGAACSAVAQPGELFTAGKVLYVFDSAYLGGTLLCFLPDGTSIKYPACRWAWREVENKRTGQLEERYQLTYLKGYGRSALWYGKLAENITQAVAARILRRTLRRLRGIAMLPVAMHTHDEIVTEPVETAADIARRELRTLMELNEPWDHDLPLKAEVSSNWYYTKAKLKV